MNWRYVKPTTIDRVLSAEEKYGVILPYDLKRLILQYNNGRPEKNRFNVCGKDRVFKKMLSYNPGDKENIYPYIDILREKSADLFPIASDPAGNFICLSNNQIVFWEHELGVKEYICNTISDLLNLLH